MSARKRPASFTRDVMRAMLGLIATAVFASTAQAATSPCRVAYPSDSRIAWHCHRLGKDESLETLFGDRWVDVARLNRIDRRHAVAGVSIKVPDRLEDLDGFSPMPSHFAEGEDDARLIVIDLAEQFAGAYEYGELAFSVPVATGRAGHPTPSGEFRISAHHRDHRSSLYFVGRTRRPYPMHFGLRFHVSPGGVSYWMHGRDMPGFPASHGCVGLYDEAMQKDVYGKPSQPHLSDARLLYEWVLGEIGDSGRMQLLDGPRVLILHEAPR